MWHLREASIGAAVLIPILTFWRVKNVCGNLSVSERLNSFGYSKEEEYADFESMNFGSVSQVIEEEDGEEEKVLDPNGGL
jgi:hypothetical protein